MQTRMIRMKPAARKLCFKSMRARGELVAS
jgi:hypothetical protein